MAVEIQLDDITYTGNEPDSVGEVIKRGVFNTDELTDLGFTVREDVVVREKMYLAAMREYITRKRNACAEKTNSGRLIVREKFLETTNLQIWDQICAEDFGGTFFELARKKGYDINDLEDTQIEELLVEMYTNIWKRDQQAIIQFGDTAISTAPPAGDEEDWTDAQKADYAKRLTLSTMDGFWKMVFAGVALKAADATDPDGITRVLTIPSGTLPANYTRDVVLPALYEGQPALMDQVDDEEKVFVLSKTLYANLTASLRNLATNGEAASTVFKDGAGNLTYEGIPIVKNKRIEQEVATVPRRAYLMVKGGFQIGTDTIKDAQTLRTWYSKDTDLNNVQVRYKMGMQYLDGDVVVVAYGG